MKKFQVQLKANEKLGKVYDCGKQILSEKLFQHARFNE